MTALLQFMGQLKQKVFQQPMVSPILQKSQKFLLMRKKMKAKAIIPKKIFPSMTRKRGLLQ
ncbi:hypothetical protein CJH10_12350 [Salmonella enterica]|nr:hypothetical protein [Salmonella enterica subsp. enterica]EAB2723622.1 hypothetical protein [Salmonella enterica]ECE0469821.1 hypothetical protein [Salmonella enterica subsp. enterica serovar Glostrup]ODJ08437.1 hypothetical protein AIZ00_08310 [Salmonella enterica subsp. enterica serovar Typhimurium]EAM8424445.1 hypothetical protein [Salmonella enterica]